MILAQICIGTMRSKHCCVADDNHNRYHNHRSCAEQARSTARGGSLRPSTRTTPPRTAATQLDGAWAPVGQSTQCAATGRATSGWPLAARCGLLSTRSARLELGLSSRTEPLRVCQTMVVLVLSSLVTFRYYTLSQSSTHQSSCYAHYTEKKAGAERGSLSHSH